MVSIGTAGRQQRKWSIPNLLFKRFQVIAASSLSVALMLTATIAQAQKAGDFNGTGSARPLVPNNVEPLSPSAVKGGLFSTDAAKQLLAEAQSAVSAQNYSLAATKLQDARQVGNQLSNFYQALASSFLGADSQVSDSLRRKALDTAQIRDQATYQLALVYRAQNKPELAIPLLIEIVRSQSPSRDLGQKSYQQLLELGFVDMPYPRTGTASPKATTPLPTVSPPPQKTKK